MQRSQGRYPTPKPKSASGALTRRRASLPGLRASEVEDQGLFVTVIKKALFGLAGFILSGLILVTFACFIAYSSADPGSLITPIATAILLISSFIGGFITAKLVHESPLLCGIVCGAMCTVSMLILSLCFTGAQSSHYTFFQGLLLHAFAILFSILGAYAGNFKRKPNPRKRRFGN
ncbi:MAG: TIGR04086 family membrane protein [Ruminococcaceae bacterium]|nr:TIGR04086 family membrane protein [Oscillospiraceae bacterium]